jgi:hypothetical protein
MTFAGEHRQVLRLVPGAGRLQSSLALLFIATLAGASAWHVGAGWITTLGLFISLVVYGFLTDAIQHRRLQGAETLAIRPDGTAQLLESDGTPVLEAACLATNWNSPWLIILDLGSNSRFRIGVTIWRYRQAPDEFRRLRIRCLLGWDAETHEFWSHPPEIS